MKSRGSSKIILWIYFEYSSLRWVIFVELVDRKMYDKRRFQGYFPTQKTPRDFD